MAIAHDADSNSGAQTVATFTWLHTCTGSNLLLAVSVVIKDTSTSTVSSITYNGVALTFIRRDRLTVDALTSELWYLKGPATGSNTISVTLANAPATAAFGGAVSLTGVDQTSPLDASNGLGHDSTTQPSVSVTTIADNCWIVSGMIDNVDDVIVEGQTRAWNVQDSVNVAAYGGEYFGPQTPPGAKAMTWSGLSNSWAIGAASFKPAVGAAAVNPSDLLIGAELYAQIASQSPDIDTAFAIFSTDDQNTLLSLVLLSYLHDIDMVAFNPPPPSIQPSAEDDFMLYLAGWRVYLDDTAGFAPVPPIQQPSGEDDFVAVLPFVSLAAFVDVVDLGFVQAPVGPGGGLYYWYGIWPQ